MEDVGRVDVGRGRIKRVDRLRGRVPAGREGERRPTAISASSSTSERRGTRDAPDVVPALRLAIVDLDAPFSDKEALAQVDRPGLARRDGDRLGGRRRPSRRPRLREGLRDAKREALGGDADRNVGADRERVADGERVGDRLSLKGGRGMEKMQRSVRGQSSSSQRAL